MSYKKSYRRKTRRALKPKVPNTLVQAYNMGVKALKAVNYIRGMINCEKKFHNNLKDSGTYNINKAGVLFQLSDIGQGDADNNRDGTSILARSLYFKLKLTMHLSATNTSVRCIIFQQKDNDGTPTIADMLEYTNSDYATISPLNKDSNGQYKIIRDRLISLSSNAKSEGYINEYIKIFTHIKWTGSLSTDTGKGQIYVALISDESSNYPTFYMASKLGFYDN